MGKEGCQLPGPGGIVGAGVAGGVGGAGGWEVAVEPGDGGRPDPAGGPEAPAVGVPPTVGPPVAPEVGPPVVPGEAEPDVGAPLPGEPLGPPGRPPTATIE